MIAVAMQDNPILLDPMHALSAGERTLLRKLLRDGPAHSAGFGKGWMLAGTRYREGAFGRFIDRGICRFYRDGAGVWVALTYTGRLAAEKITPSKPAAVAPPDDD